MRLIRTIVLTSALVASSASAQVAMGSIQMWNTNFMLNQQILQMANKPLFDKKALAPQHFNGEGLDAARGTSVAASTVLPRLGTATGPQKIAATFPEKLRPEAERVLQGLLTNYARVEQRFNIPRHDLAGAVAMFLSGSYEAYTDTSIEPSHFKALVAQMRQVIGSNPDFAKASNAEKQEMYEQMAILGMFIAGTQDELARKPNPQVAANMKQAAKGYLEQFLKADVDRVHMTERGLVIQ